MNFLMVSWELRIVVQALVNRIGVTRFRREEGSMPSWWSVAGPPTASLSQQLG